MQLIHAPKKSEHCLQMVLACAKNNHQQKFRSYNKSNNLFLFLTNHIHVLWFCKHPHLEVFSFQQGFFLLNQVFQMTYTHIKNRFDSLVSTWHELQRSRHIISPKTRAQFSQAILLGKTKPWGQLEMLSKSGCWILTNSWYLQTRANLDKKII